MRVISLVAVASCFFVSAPALAQDWIEYSSRADFFRINFPGQPQVREIMYRTEYSIDLPARVYSVENGPNRYVVTVVDFAENESKHAERVKVCRAASPDGATCNNRAELDLRGAIVHASWRFFQREARFTEFSYYQADGIEGNRLGFINPDGSRTSAAIHMHENRLYIIEGTTPAGAAPPLLFQQSMEFIDKDGNTISYRSIYSNAYPPPPRAR